MTKGQLLKILEPYSDELEIIVKIPLGDTTYKELESKGYVQCIRIGGFFQKSETGDTEGCILVG